MNKRYNCLTNKAFFMYLIRKFQQFLSLNALIYLLTSFTYTATVMQARYGTHLRANEIQGVCYVSSKRGTHLVLYEGNTFTPNQKLTTGKAVRNWKCSLYYKEKCRARVITRQEGDMEFIRAAVTTHTHPKRFPQFCHLTRK